MRSRRALLKGMVVFFSPIISGCLVGDDSSPVTPPEERDRPCWEKVSGEEIQSKNLFNESSEDEMYLPSSELHSSYERFEDENNPEFKAYVYTEDYSHTLLQKVKVYSNETDAIEKYENIGDKFDSPQHFGIGDGALREIDDKGAELVMTKSNALGHLKSYVPEPPNDAPESPYSPRLMVTNYARELRDWWGGTSDFRKEPGFCRESVRRNT